MQDLLSEHTDLGKVICRAYPLSHLGNLPEEEVGSMGQVRWIDGDRNLDGTLDVGPRSGDLVCSLDGVGLVILIVGEGYCASFEVPASVI